MKGVQGGSINDCRLVADEHLLYIIKGVDDHRSGVAEADLEDRLIVLTPPFLADRGMVLAQL